MRNKKRIIVIDFDGTINNNQEVIDRINKLHNRGHWIIVHTARPDKIKAWVRTWLRVHEVKFDELIMDKPLGDVYIDNKNLSIEAFVKGRWREKTF